MGTPVNMPAPEQEELYKYSKCYVIKTFISYWAMGNVPDVQWMGLNLVNLWAANVLYNCSKQSNRQISRKLIICHSINILSVGKAEDVHKGACGREACSACQSSPAVGMWKCGVLRCSVDTYIYILWQVLPSSLFVFGKKEKKNSMVEGCKPDKYMYMVYIICSRCNGLLSHLLPKCSNKPHILFSSP